MRVVVVDIENIRLRGIRYKINLSNIDTVIFVGNTLVNVLVMDFKDIDNVFAGNTLMNMLIMDFKGVNNIIILGHKEYEIKLANFKYIVESGVKYSVHIDNWNHKYYIVNRLINEDDELIIYTNCDYGHDVLARLHNNIEIHVI